MRYVLGEEGARKFKQLTNPAFNTGNKRQNASMHAIDNMYPHPFEVRWTDSMISGGGYAIWLPPGCLNIDGTTIEPKEWLPYVGGDGGKINPNISDDWWYKLSDKVAVTSEDIDKLSSFNLYLFSTNDTALITLSGPDSDLLQTAKGIVHIAQVENYRSKPNVKSSLILDDTRRKPFNLVKDQDYEGAGISWFMMNCIFEVDGKIVKVDGGIKGPIQPKLSTSGEWYALRLVRFSKSTQEESEDAWGIDRIKINGYSIDEIVAALDKLDIEELVSSNEVLPIKAKAVYPLYVQSSLGGIVYDLRDAWYNIGVDSADEKSVALTGDTLSSSIEKLSSEYHLNHFHDRENDLSVGQILSGSNPPIWMVNDYDLLVRHRGQTNPNGKYANELHYLCLQDLVDNLSSGTRPGGGQDEIEPDQLSSIPVAGMFAWTESTKTIGPGGCMVGRQWYTCTNGIGSGKLDGLYQLKVTMHSDNATLMVVSDAPLGKAPTANQNYAETWIPIYQIVDGKIAADYRGAFVVPAYE